MPEDIPDNGFEDAGVRDTAVEDTDSVEHSGPPADRPETVREDPLPDEVRSSARATPARRPAQKSRAPSRAPRSSTAKATKKTSKAGSPDAKPTPRRTTAPSRDGTSARDGSDAPRSDLDVTDKVPLDTGLSEETPERMSAAPRSVSATPRPVSAAPNLENGVEQDDSPGQADLAAPAPGETEAAAWPVRMWRARTKTWTIARGWVVVVGLVLAGLIAGFIVINIGNNSLDDARTSALTAARKYAVELGGYDYRHLNRDFGAVLADSTPVFRRSFMQSSAGLRSTLVQYHATSKATVIGAGLQSATTDRAVVLVFLDQIIANSQQAAPTTDRSRVLLTLVHSNGRWLINDVKLR